MLTRHYVHLRPLSPEERAELVKRSASRSESALVVAHAKQLLAVADGFSFTQAAAKSGYKSGDIVSLLVRRFNTVGIEAIFPRYSGGRSVVYSPEDRAKIVALALSTPDREEDGTVVWSMTTLCRALHGRGYPHISASTVWQILREAGLSWQASRTWCDTGTAQRKRKSGLVTLTDPETDAKKN